MKESGFASENSTAKFEQLDYSDQRLSLKQEINVGDYINYLNENKDFIRDYITGDLNEDTFLSLEVRVKAIEILTIARLLILKSFDIHSVEYDGRFPEYSLSELSLSDEDDSLCDGLLPLFSILKLKSKSSVHFINIQGEKVFDIESDMFGVQIDFQSQSPSAIIKDQNGGSIKALKVKSIWMKYSQIPIEISDDIYVPLGALEMSSELVDFHAKLDLTGNEAKVFKVLKEFSFTSDLSGNELKEDMFEFFVQLVEKNVLDSDSFTLLFDFFLNTDPIFLLRREDLFPNQELSERIIQSLIKNKCKLNHLDLKLVFNIFKNVPNLGVDSFTVFLKQIPNTRFGLISHVFDTCKDRSAFRDAFYNCLQQLGLSEIWVLKNAAELLKYYSKAQVKVLITLHKLSDYCIERNRNALYTIFNEAWLRSFTADKPILYIDEFVSRDVKRRLTVITQRFTLKYSIHRLCNIVNVRGLQHLNEFLSFLEASDANIQLFESSYFSTERMVIMLEMNLFASSGFPDSLIDFNITSHATSDADKAVRS
ncbi:hypothetical protein HOH51_02980, partial [bacterium]|nr:hypothetical protein [bacterium]